MVTIATFNEPDKAKRLKQRFQQAGINADKFCKPKRIESPLRKDKGAS